MVKREELKKPLRNDLMKVTALLGCKITPVISDYGDRVEEKARRETLREVKGKFDKIWDNIRCKKCGKGKSRTEYKGTWRVCRECRSRKKVKT